MAKTHFVHLRKRDDSKKPVCKGGITVAYRYNENDNLLEFTYAVCSKKDNFCRRIGRQVAAGRLSKGDTLAVSFETVGATDPRFPAPGFTDVAKYLSTLFQDAL